MHIRCSLLHVDSKITKLDNITQNNLKMNMAFNNWYYFISLIRVMIRHLIRHSYTLGRL